MNCYLPWNLKDMTNISAEKLQKNISQQSSYIASEGITKIQYRESLAACLPHPDLIRDR